MYNGTKISDQQYESIVSDQEAVLDIATRELNGGKAHKKKSESCWAPKPIDQGIDKNAATSLAAAFAHHTALVRALGVSCHIEKKNGKK